VHAAVPVGGEEQLPAPPRLPLLPFQGLGVAGLANLRGNHGQDVRTQPRELLGVESVGVTDQLGLGLLSNVGGDVLGQLTHCASDRDGL